MRMRVIGITGTFGAGKGTIVGYLQGGYKVKHFSIRTGITKCVYDHYGVLISNRDDLRTYANRLRKEFGPDIFIRRAAERAEGNKNCHIAVIESIRCLGEVDYLAKRYKNLFSLLAVDAEQGERFRRVTSRGDATDNVTFEEFCRQESAELENTEPWEPNLTRCITRANRIILNNGSEEDLHTAVDKFLYENLI